MDNTINQRAPFAAMVLWSVFSLVLGCGPLHSSRTQRDQPKDRTRIGTLLTQIRKEASLPSALPPPSNNRLWRPDLAILSYADFEGDSITLHNVRNCRYRTEEDYDVRHYDLRFALDEVRTVDFIVVPFKNAKLLAHTMLSFGLVDGRHFIVSVEARLEQGEKYSPYGGSMRGYELLYVIGDERDLIPLRTEVRQVDVYLYPGNANPDQVQDLLVDMLRRANQLASHPEYYDTLTNNCTTNIVDHINRLRPGTVQLDPRVLLPGHSDNLAYELGLLKIDGKFDEVKERYRINVLSAIYQDDPDFSTKIRRHDPTSL